ncbi:MAG: GGDEF domain-containing protein [Terracidiphilus sp.]
MQIEATTYPVQEPNQNLLHRAYFIEQICLVLAIQIVLINLLSHAFTAVDGLLPAGLLHMRVVSAVAILYATVALFFTEAGRSRKVQHIGNTLAGLTTLIAAATFWAPASQVFSRFDSALNGSPLPQSQGSIHASALAFLLLGIVILLIRSRDRFLGRIADTSASLLVLIVLVVISESFFAMAQIPGSSTAGLPSFPTLVCLTLLTLVVVFRRAEYGVFAVFLGDGIGGRIARILAPILLVMPFLRELGRARMMNAQLVPAHYPTAVLTSLATIIALVLLLFLARLINRMQNEIHDLTLRDELTGLYNFRGFNLFAEQAFLLARRAKVPFGVLFIAMDNLKLINDELGHSAGSVSLIETAKILTANFRETDVIGRLGGDEFVVAGQFDSEEISAAIDRLRSAAAAKTHVAGSRFFLSLSMGYAATDHSTEESLKHVVARADKAMYKEKRAKKRLALA